MFRRLKANEIDVRVQSITEKGAVLLLYKDARCDMNILDETVGNKFWKREHSRDNMNCTVSIWNGEIGQWISKEDTGTESFTEKEKGLASDSFKRACFNWGIGRELYTAGFIYVKADKMEIKNNNGKFSTYDKFHVSKIEYDESGNITVLQILNQNNESVFARGAEKKTENKNIATEAQKAKIKKLYTDKKMHKDDFTKLLEKHHASFDTMTKETAAMIIEELEK